MKHTPMALLLAACLAACQPVELRVVSVESPQAAGLSLRELPAAALRSVGVPYGLAVVKAGALAQQAGLKIGDVVYGVNQRHLRRFEDFTQLIAERRDDRLALLVRRSGADLYVTIDLTGGSPARGTPLRT